MTKEEKIKECWGANYEAFKEHINEDGIAIYPYFQKHEMIEDVRPLELIGSNFRPKSLQGIENNNGWIKIESEDDLPKEYDFYDACCFSEKFPKDVPMFYGCNLPDLRNYFNEELITHYRPIVKHDLPLY